MTADASPTIDDIRATLHRIAESAIRPELGALIRQLGDLLHAQLQQSHGDELARLRADMTAVLRAYETEQTQRMERLVQRVHTLSNHFMAVEWRLDEFIAFVDIKIDSIIAALHDRASEQQQ